MPPAIKRLYLNRKIDITILAEKILALPAVTRILEFILGNICKNKKYKLVRKHKIDDKRKKDPKLNL